MTHEDADHYAAKHPKGTTCDSQIAEALKQVISGGQITCAAAHNIAKQLKISPAVVGMNMDLLEIRLKKCQLGLFGYGKQKKAVKPLKNIPLELNRAIRESMTDGRISCKKCWEAAQRTGRSKLDVSGTCDTQNIKISPCQLGAF